MSKLLKNTSKSYHQLGFPDIAGIPRMGYQSGLYSQVFYNNCISAHSASKAHQGGAGWGHTCPERRPPMARCPLRLRRSQAKWPPGLRTSRKNWRFTLRCHGWHGWEFWLRKSSIDGFSSTPCWMKLEGKAMIFVQWDMIEFDEIKKKTWVQNGMYMSRLMSYMIEW